MMQNHFPFSTELLFTGGDKLWSKENSVALNVDIAGRSPTVRQDRHYVLNAKVLTFTGQKRIGAMLVEVSEEGAVVVLVNLQQSRRNEDASRTKTRHGV